MTRLFCRLAPIVCSSALLLGAGAAADEPEPVDFQKIDSAVFARFDDGDERLTAAEIGDYPWARLDTDGDGRVTKQEFLSGRLNERITLILERDHERAWRLLDWTGDGRLTGRELDEGTWLAFDVNRDGTVEKAEFLSLRGPPAAAVEHNPFAPAPATPTPTAPATGPVVEPDGWVTFQERGIEFRMPAGATRSEVNGSAVFSFIAADGLQHYHLVIGDFGDPEAEKKASEKFALRREYFVNTLACEVLDETKIDLSGHPGRDLTVRDAEGGTIRERWLIVGSRNIEASVPIRNQSTAEVNRFFRSIKASDPYTAAPVPTAPTTEPADDVAADGWKTYQEQDLEFRMPTGAKREVFPKAITFNFDTADQHTTYHASIRETGDPEAETNATKELDEDRGIFIFATKGKVLEEKQLELSGHPGRAQTMESIDGYLYRQRTFLVGSRMIRVRVITDEQSKTTPAEIERFLASIKLLNSPGVAPAAPPAVDDVPAAPRTLLPSPPSLPPPDAPPAPPAAAAPPAAPPGL